MQIFNSPFKTTQSWTSQGAILNYGTGTDYKTFEEIPLMISGLGITYTQQATPIFPMNTDGNGNATKINVRGAPNGTLTLQSIYCPIPKNIGAFLEMASRGCVGPDESMKVSIRPFGDIKCAGGSNVVNDNIFWLEGVELNSLSINIQSGEVTLVNMPLGFTFTSLEFRKK